MALTGRVNVLGTVPTIVAKEIIKYTEPNLELWPRVNKTYTAGVNVGDRVQVPTYNDTSITPDSSITIATQLATGTDTNFSGVVEADVSAGTANLTYTDQVIGSTTIYISQWWVCAMEVTAYAEATAQGDLVSLFRQAGMDTLPVRMDTTVGALIAGFTTNAALGTVAVALTDDVILDGMSRLDAGNVPSEGRSYVFSAQEKANYLKIDKYVNSLYRGNTAALTKGEIGDLYGMSWAWTTQIPVSGAGHSNFMFHRDAIGVSARKEPMTKVAEGPDPQFSQRIVTMAIWGANETRDRFGQILNGL